MTTAAHYLTWPAVAVTAGHVRRQPHQYTGIWPACWTRFGTYGPAQSIGTRCWPNRSSATRSPIRSACWACSSPSPVMQRIWKIDYHEDVNRLRNLNVVEKEIYNRTVCITNPKRNRRADSRIEGTGELDRSSWPIEAKRHNATGGRRVPSWSWAISSASSARPEDVDIAVSRLGDLTSEHLELDRS